MNNLKRHDIKPIDMLEPLKREHIGVLLATGDSNANRFGAVLTVAGETVDLGDAVVTGYFIKPECDTVLCEGVVDGSTVYVDLPAACYTQSGAFSLAIKISSTEVIGTVRVIDGVVRLTQTDTLIDPGEVVPSLDKLLAHIAEMEAAVEEAESVAAEAKETVDVAMDIATWSAPPIVPEITGEVATIVDACEVPAHGVVSHITAVQDGEGDPSPDNVRPITGRVAVGLWHGAAYDANAGGAMSAALPEEVYGGTLDWVSGVLTVTHAAYIVTGDEGWTWNGGGNNQRFDVILKNETQSENFGGSSFDVLCSHNKAAAGTNRAGVWVTNNGDGLRLRWKDDGGIDGTFGGDVTAFTAWLREQHTAGTPVTYVYRVEQPRTIQMTPQQLTMLKGSNALWSDTGDTTVKYMADTKTYIDNKFDALYNAILAQGANV